MSAGGSIAVDAEGGEAAVGELDEVGLLALAGGVGGGDEGGVGGEAAGGLAVEGEGAELQRGLGGDLLGGGAAGEEILDGGGVLLDLLGRLLERLAPGDVGLGLLEGGGVRRRGRR